MNFVRQRICACLLRLFYLCWHVIEGFTLFLQRSNHVTFNLGLRYIHKLFSLLNGDENRVQHLELFTLLLYNVNLDGAPCDDNIITLVETVAAQDWLHAVQRGHSIALSGRSFRESFNFSVLHTFGNRLLLKMMLCILFTML